MVTAETGNGKSTQLLQYAAEYFGGLVVCTQPRVIAAISLARRVADEYDGVSVGRSVDYRVGYASDGKDNNQVPGTDILFKCQMGHLFMKIKTIVSYVTFEC